MEKLPFRNQKTTLVDQVEEMLVDYMTANGLRPGDSLPNEMELSRSLGVARTVLREALSRFKMTGMIESRPRRGMVLAEPFLLGGMKRIVNPLLMTEGTLLDILEFRVDLEIGCTGSIFRNLRDEHIRELEAIVRAGEVFGNNEYAPVSEFNFHTKLYEITGNRTINEFQQIIHPVMQFVKDKYKDYFAPIALRMQESGEQVGHAELLSYLRRRDEEGYLRAIRQHFRIYTDYLKLRVGAERP